MNERGITKSFTSDRHFEQAGFEAIVERQLSRTRNLMHLVKRRFYLLRVTRVEVNVPAAHLANLRSQPLALCGR